MSDIYEEPLEELRDALANGEAVEAAIAEIAQDHGVPAEGLRRRAERAFGDLAAYGDKKAVERDLLADQEQKARERMKLVDIARQYGKNSPEYADQAANIYFGITKDTKNLRDRYLEFWEHEVGDDQ